MRNAWKLVRPADAPAALRMHLVGANASAQGVSEDALPGKNNYFIGNDRTKWRTNIPNYGRVRYRGVYPGIDLVYYGNQRLLEHDFEVAPGADPRRIRLAFEGIQRAAVEKSGDLVLRLADGEVRLQKPLIYQQNAAHAVAGPGGVAHRLRRRGHNPDAILVLVPGNAGFKGSDYYGDRYLGDVAALVLGDGHGSAVTRTRQVARAELCQFVGGNSQGAWPPACSPFFIPDEPSAIGNDPSNDI